MDRPVTVESDDVYLKMGLPIPDDAFRRARDHASYFLIGRWYSIWWTHRIEALAAQLVGKEVLLAPNVDEARAQYRIAFAQIAQQLTLGESLSVPLAPHVLGGSLNKAHEQLIIAARQRKEKESRQW